MYKHLIKGLSLHWTIYLSIKLHKKHSLKQLFITYINNVCFYILLKLDNRHQYLISNIKHINIFLYTVDKVSASEITFY